MKIIGVSFGKSARPHFIHYAWMRAIGVEPVKYTFFEVRKIFPSLGWVNHLLGYVKGIFIPRGDVYFLSSLGALSAVMFKKGKVVCINSDTFITDTKKSKGLARYYREWLLKRVDGIIPTAPLMKSLGEEFTKVPQEIVFPFSDVERFSSVTPDYESPNICSVATARYSKGGDILREVFLKYKGDYPSAKLFVLGTGDMQEKLRATEDVDNPGFADPREYMGKSGLYINAARIEPFGVNILEAMRSGFAPIVTKYSGASAIVERVDKSLVVDADCDKILTKALDLQKDVELKRKLGEKARIIAQEYTEEKSVNDFKKSWNLLMDRI